MSTTVDPSTSQLYYDVALRMIDLQVSSYDAIDRKAFQVLAAASVTLPVTVSILVSLVPQETDGISYVPLAIAAVAYILVLAFGINCLRTRQIQQRPDLALLECNSRNEEYETVLVWIADEYSRAFTENQEILKRKNNSAWWAIVAFFIQGASLALAASLFAVL